MHKVTVYLTDELYQDFERLAALHAKRHPEDGDHNPGKQRLLRRALAIGFRQIGKQK